MKPTPLRFLAGQEAMARTRPLHMVGSSIGTWRFACLAKPDPVAACRRFEASYVEKDRVPDLLEPLLP